MRYLVSILPRLLALPLLWAGLLAASPDAEIRAVLDAQVSAWNRGDIATFMQGYDKSDETIFIGKDIARGWQGVLERYQKSYPTSERMGRLAFRDIEVHPLGPDHALVIGRFHLTRSAAAGGDASGVFSLTFRRGRTGAWTIIADHTS